jgi:hypothetical protein
MRMRNTALLLVLLSTTAFAEQSSTARIRISGQVSRMGSLSLAAADREIVPLGAGAANSRQVHIALRPATSSRTITVPLVARSNAPYRLVVKSSQPLRVGIRSVNPNAGMTRLAPDATNVHTIEGQLTASAGELTILEGGRISSAGTDATPDNAIRMTVDVELPPDLPEAELTFTIELY